MVFNDFLRKIISSKPKCPYCHRELPKFPLRKSKCPLSRKCELLQYQQQGIKKVRISTTGDRACENCKLLEGKVFSIEEALEKMPLPVKNCLHKLNPDAPAGWCRCLYEPVLEDRKIFLKF